MIATESPPAAPPPVAPPTWDVRLEDTDVPVGRHTTARGVRITAAPGVPASADPAVLDAFRAAIDKARGEFLSTSADVATANKLRDAYQAAQTDASAARKQAARLRADAVAALSRGDNPDADEAAARDADATAARLDERAERLAPLVEDAQAKAASALRSHLRAVRLTFAEPLAAKHEAAARQLQDAVARLVPVAADLAATRSAVDRLDLDDELPGALDFRAARVADARDNLRRLVDEFRTLAPHHRVVVINAVKKNRTGEVGLTADEAAAVAAMPTLARVTRGRVTVRETLATLPVADLAQDCQDVASLLLALRR